MTDDAGLLTEFLDGTLSAARRDELLQRLAREPALAAALAEAEAGRALLLGLRPAEVPADFARKTRGRLKRKRGFRPRRLPLQRFGIEAFAVVALVVMFAVYFFLEMDRGLGRLEDAPPPPDTSSR